MMFMRQAKYYTSNHNIQERQTHDVQHPSHTSHVMQECPTQEHPTNGANNNDSSQTSCQNLALQNNLL
ncbi:hypothetical protein F8M41_016455 [Gigaspora margarita]|uniref:Uncharacterized protein n=1 Tax=Gigaspora margarita TaxID=4874 RepID=A0A8H4APJ3_GIGMA|nr:hypothetical protein F8M41_016455 [Gigaspora margarita]